MRTYTYYPHAGIASAQNAIDVDNLQNATGGGGSTGQLQAAPPTFSPPGGSYLGAIMLTLSTPTPGGNIYYTTNGDLPDVNATFYTGPFAVAANELVRAITIAPTYINSPIVEAQYTIVYPQVSTPVFIIQDATQVVADVTFSPPATQFVHSINVTLATVTAGASIYYTLDGSTPTIASLLYTGPITVSADTLVRAFAVKPSYANSGVTQASYMEVVPTTIEFYRYSPGSVIWFDTHTVGELTATVGTNTNLYIETTGSAATFNFIYDGAPLFAQIDMGVDGTDGNSNTQSATLSGAGNSIIIALNSPPGSNSGYFRAGASTFSTITFNIYSW